MIFELISVLDIVCFENHRIIAYGCSVRNAGIKYVLHIASDLFDGHRRRIGRIVLDF